MSLLAKNLLGVFLVASCATIGLARMPDDDAGKAKLTAQSLAESLMPIRPGQPGDRPFWNRYARRFIHAPAFDVDADPWPLVRAYRLTVHSKANGKDYVFEAAHPYAPLTPIWKDVPVGPATLTVESLKERGGKPVKVTGTREFFRAAMFHGPYGNPVLPYGESAKRALEFQFRQPHYQAWKDGKPGPYHYHCYPAKMFAATTKGMVALARITDDPRAAKQALLIARNAATHLIGLCDPAGSPLAFVPPTYDDQHPVAKKSSWWKQRAEGRVMLTESFFAADAWLDLYDVTGDAEYLEAVKRMVATYAKCQMPDGTWPLKVWRKTGKPFGANVCIPTRQILILDRLVSQYGLQEFQPVLDKAVQWVWDNPMRNYKWEGQFEDVPFNSGYLNLTHLGAVDFARYLLHHVKQHPEYATTADTLLRFAEDQFVIWEKPTLRWNNAVVPCALEQYWCYRPIGASALHLVQGWTEAYVVTSNELYLAKARSLANTQTAVQDPETGQYRTFWYDDGTNKTNNWDNCAVNCACVMLELDNVVKSKSR